MDWRKGTGEMKNLNVQQNRKQMQRYREALFRYPPRGARAGGLYVAQPGRGACVLNSRATDAIAGKPSMAAPLM
jgi:hypothetical protein